MFGRATITTLDIGPHSSKFSFRRNVTAFIASSTRKIISEFFRCCIFRIIRFSIFVTVVNNQRSRSTSYLHLIRFLYQLSTKQTLAHQAILSTCNEATFSCKYLGLCYFARKRVVTKVERNDADHHAVMKFSSCRNKTLPQLVRIVDWQSIHALLQYPNSDVPTSSSLSLEQSSTASITETYC